MDVASHGGPMRLALRVLILIALALSLGVCGSVDEASSTTTPTGAVVSTTSGQTSTREASTTMTTPQVSTTTTVPAVSVTRVRDVVYRADGSSSAHSTVDVFIPDTADGRPAVLLLHGIDQNLNGKIETPLDALGKEIARMGATVFYPRWNTFSGWSLTSADDLYCMGPFISQHAVEHGATSDQVVVVGHSMGAEAGSNLAFRSFDVPPGGECTAVGTNPTAAAFVGIGGSYGWLAKPTESDSQTFLVKSGSCNTPQHQAPGTETVAPGLTAEQGYELDGYSSMHLAAPDLDVVLVVGSLDPYLCTSPPNTEDFGVALRDRGINAQVIEIDGAGHEDIVNPRSESG